MHLSPEVAVDLIEKHAGEPETAFWHAHIEICGDCKGELEKWTAFHKLLKREHLESAPDLSLRNALGIFQQPVVEKASFREVLASLVFDSFTQPALAGARGAAASARQMVLRAEGYDIHLKLWGNPPARRMAGQVLARGEGAFVHGARLHLLLDGERIGSTAVDKFGEFEFEEVPEGFLSLQIDLPHLTVVGSLSGTEAS